MTTMTQKHFPVGIKDVTAEQATHVLWHFGEREVGLEPGSFTAQLLQLFEAADPENFARLAGGFPAYAAAWRLGKEWESGISVLAEIAGRG